MKNILVTLLTLGCAATTLAQPRVYLSENTGSNLAGQVSFPPAAELPVIRELPDALEGVTSFNDWERRRNVIGALIQHYGIGEKPVVSPEQVKARLTAPERRNNAGPMGGGPMGGRGMGMGRGPMAGAVGDTTLVVDVTVGGQTLTISSTIRYPKEGQPPYAVIIGTDMISLPRQLYEGKPIATMTFQSAQVNDYKQFGQHHERGEHDFDRLYPHLKDNGAYSEWAWGMSRLIDGLQQLGPEATKIDVQRICVTGCSYAGKMALYCGAFDERIALTIAQEPGGGGAAVWRYTQPLDSVENLDKTDYHWFMESQRENFGGENVFRLPYDQHELCAMVCPRALVLLGNPDYVWLADDAMRVSAEAAKKVWERFGIADRFACDIVGGHPHCQLPESQWPLVQSFIDRFLLNSEGAGPQ